MSVTYTPNHEDRQGNRVRGTLTLVNHSRKTFSGWTITLAFPGDEIDWVSAPGADWLPFDTWSVSGTTLTLSAALPSEALGPHATENIAISGHGSADSPSSCSFNGSACQG